MECPKCGAEIDKGALVCPNCKKVLKIICPVCKTINTKNTCKKCGEVLVTKCAKCGKINLLKNSHCVKCGFSNEISAVMGESNTDTFAVVRLDFPNSNVVKAKLGSNQLYRKFMANIDAMINSYVQTLNVRRQIIKGETYVIRFSKDYTFTSSANTAIQATIELVNMLTRVNIKLLKKKGVALKCNFSIFKRSSDQNPYDLDIGFHANMVANSDQIDMKAMEAFQVITDETFWDIYSGHYKMETLNTAFLSGQMKRFFEIDIRDFMDVGELLKNEAQKDQEMEEPEIPMFVQSALVDQEKITMDVLAKENELDDDGIYDIEGIDFNEINCAFMKVEGMNVFDAVVKTLQEVPKGILAIKASPMYQPYTLKLLSAADELGMYENIIPITCHDDMKFSPYSFFRDLISSIFEYTISQKLFDSNDFSMFENVDQFGLVEDLIRLNQRPMQNMEEVRERYCNVFVSLLQAIPNTLIYIENFEKIDESSLFVLEKLFDYLDELNISYLISYDKNYSLHKNFHFLLSRGYYTEITLTPTPFQTIVNADYDFYKNILTDFYFQRIAKYACGSTLFLDFAIQYLLESGVYEYTENSIAMVNPKTIIIPSGLEKLIKRRLNLLKDNEESIKFLTMLVLLGTRIDEKTIESLGFRNWQTTGEELAQMGYLYFYNNCIYFPNYNILRKALLEVVKPEDIAAIAQELFAKVFDDTMPAPVKTFFYDITGEHEKVICEWENLTNINLAMGDFSSYLNCSNEIMKCLEKYTDTWTKEDLEKYKISLYENVADNMYEYKPSDSIDIVAKSLDYLKQSNNIDKYVTLCSKMIHGAMEEGDYLYAMDLTHNVLSSLDNSSIDPSSPDFNLNFLVMSIIYIKILFHIGAYDDCLDIGYNVLSVLDNDKLNSIKYTIITKEELEFLIAECVGYIAVVDVLTLNEDVQEFLNLSNKVLKFIPPKYAIFVQLQKLIKGDKPVISPEMMGEDDLFSSLTFHIIQAFTTCKDNPVEFAKIMYKAKLIARSAMLYSIELFTDLMIGYAYVKLNAFEKSYSILIKIIKTAKEKGLTSILHLAWYILSIHYISEGKYELAYGVLNNSIIQMEKNGIVSEYLTMLDKVNMYKVMMCMNSKDQAQICMNQASAIVQRYGLKFNLNIDIKKFMLENSNRKETESINTTVENAGESVSESNKGNSRIPKPKFETDGEVVDPSQFFS